MIDRGDPGRPQRIDDASEIAFAGKSGVDEQGLTGRADEQRRLSALGVDEVDRQGARALLCGRNCQGSERADHLAS